MASVAALLQELDEEETILDLVYSSYDTEDLQGLSPKHLQSTYEDLRHACLSIPQIEAAINYTCACPILCDREEMLDCLKEMDRRYFLAKDLQWEFAMLDRQRKGAISITDTAFLFKMVYGDFFSKYKFERMIKARVAPDSDVSFAEVEVQLCNIPTHDWMEDLFLEEERDKEEKEFKRREEDRKRKEKEEQKQREDEMKKQLEDEDRQMREMLAKRKREEAEKKKKEAEIYKEQENNKKKESERKKIESIEIAKNAKQRAEEVARQKKEQEEQGRLAAEQQKTAERAKMAAEKKEQDRLEAEQAEQRRQEEAEKERLAEADAEQKRQEHAAKEHLATEEAEKERLENEGQAMIPEAQKSEEHQDEERQEKSVEAEVPKTIEKNERALENWKKAKDISEQILHEQRMRAVHVAKATLDAEKAEKESEDAEAAEEAEENAENEALKAADLLKNASTEEERQIAEEKKRKAEAEALKNKEKRLRLTLKAAVKIRHRPKIDAAVIEAKESEIPALHPEITIAEKVSDSIKCGEELEDAMIKRNLPELQAAVNNIKTKGYEKDHVIRISEADKLAEKLKRLEKLKKEILALDQRTISEIRSYKTPLPAIHDVMIATYILLGYKEKELKQWKFIQALLGRTGKEGLKRMVTTCEASSINMNAASIADKRYLGNHDLETVTDVSAGAATFFVWSTAMIDEARSWHEDSDFRKKVEEKRKQEEIEAKNLQDTKRASKKQRSDPVQQAKTNPKEIKTSTVKSVERKQESTGNVKGKKLDAGGNRTANAGKSRSRSPNTLGSDTSLRTRVQSPANRVANVKQNRTNSPSPKSTRKNLTTTTTRGRSKSPTKQK